MNVEILRQLDQRLLALDRSHRHFRLECRAVVPARSSCHSLLLARSIMPLLRRKSTYPGCSDFRSQLFPLGRYSSAFLISLSPETRKTSDRSFRHGPISGEELTHHQTVG
ncbi:hypothetical protein CG50_05730 [Paenirhodobacter enshiensis]|uniref:Uncharacterized protein n=1 Tax=Paenirhodobacter enshiensis TaxID=1105367 RepID=A0A086XTC7_9RHOB|nr:hypothetical protein CG50_05730 [Paenirhodobacter enshiensis]